MIFSKMSLRNGILFSLGVAAVIMVVAGVAYMLTPEPSTATSVAPPAPDLPLGHSPAAWMVAVQRSPGLSAAVRAGGLLWMAFTVGLAILEFGPDLWRRWRKGKLNHVG